MPSISQGSKFTEIPKTGIIGMLIVGVFLVGLILTPTVRPADYGIPLFTDESSTEKPVEAPPESTLVPLSDLAHGPLHEILTTLEDSVWPPVNVATSSGGGEAARKLLRRDHVRKSLRKAKKTALAIAASIADEYPGSDQALKSYAAGIDRVLTGRGIPAEQVPSYIARLDRQVTAVFKQEKAPEKAKLEWREVSAGPELQSQYAAMEKHELVGPFDPRLRLSLVRIREGYRHRGKRDPNARITVKVRGYLRGDHVKEVHVFQNGKHMRTLDLSKQTDEFGRRRFRFKQSDGVRNSFVTFRVIDVKDRTYDRTYSFYPRVTAFEWDGRGSGMYELPFLPNDPRMDRFFLVGDVMTSEGPGPAKAKRHFQDWGAPGNTF